MTERVKVPMIENYMRTEYKGQFIQSNFKNGFVEAFNNEIALKMIQN